MILVTPQQIQQTHHLLFDMLWGLSKLQWPSQPDAVSSEKMTKEDLQ